MPFRTPTTIAIAVLAALAIVACSSPQLTPTATPLPTATPMPTATPTPEPTVTSEPEGDEGIAATGIVREWADGSKDEIATTLIELVNEKLPSGIQIGEGGSLAVQFEERMTFEFHSPKSPGPSLSVWEVPVTVKTSFDVDKPIIGGTYSVTTPVTVLLDVSKELPDAISDWVVQVDGLSIKKE